MRRCKHVFRKLLYSHNQGVVLTSSKSCDHMFKELYSHVQGVLLTRSRSFTHTFEQLYSHVQGDLPTRSRSFTHTFKEFYSHVQGVVLTCSRSCSGALDRWQSMYSINRHSLVIGRGIIVTSWLLGMSMADINVLARYVNTCCLELSDSE